MSRATISDVAARAGVSKATVSRFLNGSADPMRASTRARIQVAIEALGYRPSAVARSLVNRRTNTIGLLISDFANPFYSEIVQGIETVGAENGYRVLMGSNDYDLDRAFEFVGSLAYGQVDGVLLMSSQINEELVKDFAANGVPIVLWDWPTVVPGVTAHLNTDYQAGFAAAVERLVDLGHRHFAYLSGVQGLPTTGTRVRAFRLAVSRHSEIAGVVEQEADYKMEGGHRAMRQILQVAPETTAVLCANDLTALGAVRAAREQGVAVPDDLSVVGLDDTFLTTLVQPQLSTIALPTLEIGHAAMNCMLRRLRDGEPGQPETVVFPTHFVERESTGPTPSGMRRGSHG